MPVAPAGAAAAVAVATPSPTEDGAGQRGAAPAPQALIGRERDIAALDTLLGCQRLVTVIGAGGIGKTRLAAAALWQAQARFADGVATVDLTSLTDPRLLGGAIAAALKLPVGRDGDVLAALLAAVRPLEALILLDNAEHLVEDVARLAAALVKEAPRLRVLVTSQVPLRVEHERVFRLDGLELPPGAGQTSAAEALAFGAIALFDDRLQAADRRLRVNDDNIGSVLAICRGLDGIALAIELAAARCPLLGVHGVAERLDERFRLLRFDSRSAPSRQQTLGAAMAWSHGLLTPDQQAAFRQLGVFVGTFTLDMATRVIQVPGLDEVDGIDLLAELVDHSLISVDAADPPRYRLLETGRLFALAKLAESGEQAAVRLRHAHTLRDRFAVAWAESWVMDEDSFVDRYEPDLDNLRAAIDEATQQDPAAAIELIGSATRLWRWLSLHPEALARCESAVALIGETTPPAVQARLWEGLAQLAGELSLAQARPAAIRAAELYARIGDARGRYLGLAHLVFSLSGSHGTAEAVAAFAEMQRLEDPAWPPMVRMFGRKVEANLALDQGDFEHARTATRSRLELGSACGSTREVNASLSNLADLALIAREPAEAVRLGRALLARMRRRDTATRAITMGNLLHALLAQGADDEARSVAADVVDILRQINFMFLMYVADALALLATREARWRAGGLLLAYADAAYQAQGQSREINEARAHDEALAALAAHAAGQDIAAWAHEGSRLEAAQVCALALERPDLTGHAVQAMPA